MTGYTICAAADLVPREVAEQWLTYFREELPTVAFKANTQKQVRMCACRLQGAAHGWRQRAETECERSGVQATNQLLHTSCCQRRPR